MKYSNLIVVFTFILSVNLFAQWNPNTDENTLVVDYSEPSDIDMEAIGTSDGKTYVVFWKSSPSYQLWLQVLDADGNQTLGSNGKLISNSIPMSSYTAFWYLNVDNNNNLYIGITATGNGGAYVFKLDIEGNHLWSDNGVQVGSGFQVKPLPMDDGTCIVSWLSDASYSAVIQKFDENGNPLWDNDVIVDSDASSPANLFKQSDGYFTVVYHKILSGISSNLYAQRFNSDGEPQWLSSTQISNSTTQYNGFYYGAQDEDVIYFSYFGSISNRFDSYIQRINTDGSIPWGINGSDFNVAQTDFEKSTRVAFEEGSDFVWAICSYSNVNQSHYGEFVQKFNKEDGSRLLGENGKELYPIGSENVHSGNLFVINGQPNFILKKGMDNGASPVTLDIVYLDDNGEFLWPEESLPMATYNSNKSRISTPKPINGQSVVVFSEDKGNGTEIFAQNYVNESALNDENEIISFEIPNQVHEAEINSENATILVTMPVGTDVTQLIPTIEISENANIDPEGGIAQDFTNAVIYTVTAQNGDEKEWDVTVDFNVNTSNLNNQKYLVYPNPSNGIIVIDNNRVLDVQSIIIYDFSGKVIYKTNNYKASNRLQIDLNSYEKGLYMIYLQYEDGIFTEKLLLK